MPSLIKPISLQTIITEVGIDQPSFMRDYGAICGALVIKNGAIGIFGPAQRKGRLLISDRRSPGRAVVEGFSVKVFCARSEQVVSPLRSNRGIVVGYGFSRIRGVVRQ